MSRADLTLPQVRGFAETTRTDPWWTFPAAVFAGLVFFLIYGTWAAFQGGNYFYHGQGADYLSPFMAPALFDSASVVAAGQASGHAWFGGQPAWWPAWMPMFSPAFLILWIPAGFRFTCYGFRGHYYRGIWADPIACGVGEPGFRGKAYRGERWFPLVMQNIHRYFVYLAAVLLAVKFFETWKVFRFYEDPARTEATFGIGLGSLVLFIEPFLLGAYLFGCHSIRHLIGGKKDCIGAGGARRTAYDCVSCLNRRHMLWGWISLIWVVAGDLYVRGLAHGLFSDPIFLKL